MHKSLSRSIVIFSAMLAIPMSASAVPVIFSASGADAAAIQSSVDAFRSALGANRQEIDWDDGGLSSTNTIGGTDYLNSRGIQLTTPGSGFTLATPDGLEAAFSNPTYSETFEVFSPFRLFTPNASNVTDALFFTPGTNGANASTIVGFGAIFSDVDRPAITSLVYFDSNSNLLGSVFADPFDNGLSFLGVLFNGGELISRVRITTGNTALGPNDGPNSDIVVMDNFIYADPNVVRTVPEPAIWLLLGIGLAGFYFVSYRLPTIC